MAGAGLGVFGLVKSIPGGLAAGFAFGQAALFAVEPTLTEDGAIVNAATLAAGRAGSTGVGAVAACLVFTSMLLSLGNGFLLAALVTNLLTKAGIRTLWLAETAAGASVVVGAVTAGVSAGILPPWIYITAQGMLVLIAYSNSNINDITTAFLIIFTTLYMSVLYGRMGVIIGLFVMGLTISVLFALRQALTERMTQRPNSKTGCRLLQRIFFYSVVVGLLGFSVGVTSGAAGEGTEEEMVLMLRSVLWVVFLSAGLLGAGLGTVAMVGLAQEAAEGFALGAAIISSVALRALLQSSSSLGLHGTVGGTLGAAAAAGVSLGAASVAAKQAFESRNSTVAVLGSVAVGVLLAMRGVAPKASVLTISELVITLVAVGAFVLGAPKSPFHTEVNLQRGFLTGPELLKGIGMETVTAAAAPIGAGALGAALLGTAALGSLGTAGVLAAIMLALGSTLSKMIGKSPSRASAH